MNNLVAVGTRVMATKFGRPLPSSSSLWSSQSRKLFWNCFAFVETSMDPRAHPLKRALTTTEDSTPQVEDCFQLLGIERSFSIDHVQLKQTYKDLMSRIHPDKQQQGHNDDDDYHPTATASDVTRAYSVLSRDHTRATHLLELNDIFIDERDTGVAALVGSDFLMDVMEIRESIDELDEDDVLEKRETSLRKLLEQNADSTKDLCAEMEWAFAKNDEESLREAKKLTAQLQYLNRIEETIMERLDSVQ